jgi:hypothetical protein
MLLAAKLDYADVADLLTVISTWKRGGRITISLDRDEINFYLTDGQLVVVTSSLESLHLGQSIRRLGLLTPRQLREALGHQEKLASGEPLGHLLVRRGWLTAAELERSVEEQAIAALARVIVSPRVALSFASEVSTPQGVLVSPLQIRPILVEAARRIDELLPLHDTISNPTTSLLVGGNLDTVADDLSDAEVLVALALGNRRGTVANLIRDTALETGEITRALAKLTGRGLLVVERDARPLVPEPSLG